MNTLRIPVLSVLALLSTAALPPARAADGGYSAEKDAEAKELAEEDRAVRSESGSPSQLNSNYAGKFTLFTVAQIQSSGDPTVIGRFDVDGSSDESMLVRPLSDALKAQLKKQDGKDIVINGRQRLNGKYLYAFRIVPVATGNSLRAPAGGL